MTIRYYLQLCAIFFAFVSQAQITLYRSYTQPSPTVSFYGASVETPLRTQDGGYLLTSRLWQMGFESPGGMVDAYIIKTDSNFVPQWKKKYPQACALPTGGILLFGNNTIEKVTASGTQVWIKTIPGNFTLNDAVCYGSNVRFVGNVTSYAYIPATILLVYMNDGFTLLTDSNGTYQSHQLFYSSVQNVMSAPSFTYRGSANFSKIERDAQGNFFVYSNDQWVNGIGSQMAIAKFNSSFTFQWGKTWNTNNSRTIITDIDFLPSGRIFASACTPWYTTSGYQLFTTLMKLDGNGNVVQQSLFHNKKGMGRLCKKSGSSYITTSTNVDSVFMFEVDTSMNVAWHKFRTRANAASAPVIKSGMAYTSLFRTQTPYLISNDLVGNSCSSYSIGYSLLTPSVSLINFTLSTVSSTLTVASATTNLISTQNYVDSCKCPVFVPSLQQDLCVGNSSTVNILGTGNLSWYATATGSTFLHGGSQHVFASSTPTTITVYAQDSVCVANPNRTAVSVTVHAIPILTFTPFNPTICIGGQVFVTVSGATGFTWSNNSFNINAQYLNPTSTTNYTVSGSVAPGCTDTKTMTVFVVPVPTVAVSGPTAVCTGAIGSYTASGANTYTWSGGAQGIVYTISPTNTGQTIYTVTGSNAACAVSKQFTVNFLPSPTINISITPSLVCAGTTATISAFGANTFTWSSGATTATIKPSLSTSTMFVVNGTTGGCTSSASISVPVQNPPLVSIAASQTQVCQGTPVTFTALGANSYTWNNNATGATTSVVPANNITMVVAGSDGTCVATGVLPLQVIMYPTLTVVNSPSAFCYGKSATVIASGAATYTWNNASNANSVVVVPLTNTVLVVSGSNSNCTSSSTINVPANPNPTVSILSNTGQVCAGDTAKLYASGATSYLWSTGHTSDTLLVVPASTQNYTVTGTNAQGCSANATASLVVIPLPVVTLSSTHNTLCIGQSATLNASGALSYSWTLSAGTPSAVVSPTASTIYSIVGVGAQGCKATATFMQYVSACTNINNQWERGVDISVFPNPTAGDIVLKLSETDFCVWVDIYSADGQYLLTKYITSVETNISTAQFAAGVYHLHIKGTGRSVKIIKQ